MLASAIGELRLRGRDVEVGDRAAIVLRLRQVDELLPGRNRAASDGELLIECLQSEIGRGDVRHQRRHDILLGDTTTATAERVPPRWRADTCPRNRSRRRRSPRR